MAKFKFSWGHGVIVALGFFMIFITTLVIVGNNKYMGEMVDTDYYEKTIVYQDDIDAANRANSLQSKPEIVRQANGYLVKFHNNKPNSGNIYFMRSNTSEDDVIEPIKLNSRNEQLIHAVRLKDGDYEVSLRWKENNEDYLIKTSVNWEAPSS